MAPKRIIGLLGVVSITVLLMAPQAEALLYKAFSTLCLQGALQAGLKEGTLIWKLRSVTTECLCLNEQTGKIDPKPGIGNLSTITHSFNAEPDAARDKRFVYVDGCIAEIEGQFDAWSHHYTYNEQGNIVGKAPGHECTGLTNDCFNHVCNASQPNKVEIADTCLFWGFIAEWWLYDLNNNLKLQGTDDCTWNGERDADTGIPNSSGKCDSCDLLAQPGDSNACPSECTWTCDEKVIKPKGR